MSMLNQVTARDAIRVATIDLRLANAAGETPAVRCIGHARVNKLGFVFRRQKGSHAMYKRESDKKGVVIPMHGSRTYPIGTARRMLRDMDITPEDFERLS